MASAMSTAQPEQLAPPHIGDAQCPVPHAATQPLPPGHPPVPTAPSSSLKPPTDARCIFYRTRDDLISTPPLSRQSSTARAAELAKANINPLKEGEGQTLDPERTLVIASRASQLALVQSSQVSAALSANYGQESPAFRDQTSSSSSSTKAVEPLTSQELQNLHARIERFNITEPMSFPITSMSTAGDQNVRSPLYVIGGEGRAIWTGELEVALAAGAVDAVVHSLKDVPTVLPEKFILGAICEREDPRDALVIKSGLPYKTLDDLPPGSVIGTSSVRRVAQLRARYPGLVFSDVRGNINTRIAKLDAPTGPYTALVLAAAGLIRINVAHRITAFLSRPVLLHAVGQGSLGIEVRKPPPGATPENNRDARILAMVQSIGDWRATARAEAERSLLRELEGGCSIPVGVESTFDDHDDVEGVRNEKVDVASTVEGREGHTITKAATGEASTSTATSAASSSVPRPGGLERLATDASVHRQNGNAASVLPTPQEENPLHTAASNATSAATDESSIQALLKPARAEDRSQPPASAIGFTLTATVVSLDGSRHCIHTRSRPIASVEEARTLGVEVAQELADRQGAREILDEVNRHRQLAEEADNRRREEARKRRKVSEVESQSHAQTQNGVAMEGRTAQLKQQAGVATAPSTSSPLASGTSTPTEERRAGEEGWRKLEEVVNQTNGAARNAHQQQHPSPELAHYPQVSGEIDRRGVPREDGQEKVWEV